MACGDRPTCVPVSTSTTSQLWSLNFRPAAVVPSNLDLTCKLQRLLTDGGREPEP